MSLILGKVVLTAENYYDDTYYMSTSRFKEYLSCPSRQQAVDLGFWAGHKESTALLVGNYVHSYFEGEEAHETFKTHNADKLLSTRGATKGQLKSEFKVAERMIAALNEEALFLSHYHGTDTSDVRKEEIVTGELAGIPFKCKIDSLNLTGDYFVDLKTMESIRKEVYSPTLRCYTNQATYNVVEYKYTLQMYIYQQLLYQKYGYLFTPYIVAISKEPVPDKDIILIDDNVLEMGRQIFEANAEEVRRILSYESFPQGCGRCDYCLTNKHLDSYITLGDI